MPDKTIHSAPRTPPSVPSCTYCLRPLSDLRGCEWDDGDPKPPTYGTECHPLSIAPTCYDCGAPKGTEHHASSGFDGVYFAAFGNLPVRVARWMLASL